VSNRILVVDVAIAAVVAALVLIISPGLAVTGMLGLLILFVVGVSYGWSALRRR
jgi:hypothetical protein